VLFFLSGTPLVRAQVTITITATANSTAEGYTATNPYTFVFTSGPSFANTTSSIFDATLQGYGEEVSSTDDQLWSSISGTGLNGSYVRPANSIGDTSSQLHAGQIDDPFYYLQIKAVAEVSDIGNTTLNDTAVNFILVYADGGTLPAFAFPEAYVDPIAYFASYNGTYTGFNTGPSYADQVFVYYSHSAGLVQFNITSITISATSAVPEPAICAALLGAGALGIVLGFRRRSRAPGPQSAG
jgi:hypothetical protein